MKVKIRNENINEEIIEIYLARSGETIELRSRKTNDDKGFFLTDLLIDLKNKTVEFIHNGNLDNEGFRLKR